jgi:hypothetical protein
MSYNLGALSAAVQDDLKDPNFSLTRIDRYVNRAVEAVFNTHMFRFCEKLVTGALTIGEYAYDQQSDHQATIGGVIIDETNGNLVVLNADNYLGHREFFEQYPDPSSNSRGMPSVWTEFGDEIIFDKPCAKAYTFKQRYYRHPAELVNATDVPEVPRPFRQVLEDHAKASCEKYRGNHDVAALYKQDFEDGLENMVLRFSEVQQAGPVVVGSNRNRVELT